MVATLAKERYRLLVVTVSMQQIKTKLTNCYLVEAVELKGLLAAIQSYSKPIVINMIHGGYGENGQLAAQLDNLNIDYIGSDAKSSKIAMDKWATKQLWIQHNLAVADSCLVTTVDKSTTAKFVAMNSKVVLKPCNEGSSIGLAIIDDIDKLQQALETAKQYDAKVMMEQFIDGREITVSIVNGEAQPIIEIDTGDQHYDYFNKYNANSITKYLFPSFEAKLQSTIEQLAIVAFNTIGCKDYGRVDLMLTAANKPILIEVNTVPGMTASSLLPKAVAAAGDTIADMFYKLLQLEKISA